jgi:selenium metabolism protein YedF
MKSIDARGLLCPRPLIMTKKGLSELQSGEQMEVTIDNVTAKSNIEKFLDDNGAKADCIDDNGTYKLTITKISSEQIKETEEHEYQAPSAKGKHVFVFKNERVADDELGNMLTQGFFETIKEINPLPDKIIFYHKGINLVLEGSLVLENLKHLESLGIEIMICGNCVAYYDVKEKIRVGTVSNAYDILTALSNAHHIVSP